MRFGPPRRAGARHGRWQPGSAALVVLLGLEEWFALEGHQIPLYGRMVFLQPKERAHGG